MPHAADSKEPLESQLEAHDVHDSMMHAFTIVRVWGTHLHFIYVFLYDIPYFEINDYLSDLQNISFPTIVNLLLYMGKQLTRVCKIKSALITKIGLPNLVEWSKHQAWVSQPGTRGLIGQVVGAQIGPYSQRLKLTDGA
jgi:hypothetical protein